MLISYERKHDAPLTNVIFAKDGTTLLISGISTPNLVDVTISIENITPPIELKLTPALIELPSTYSIRISVDDIISAVIPELKFNANSSSLLTSRALSEITVTAHSSSEGTSTLTDYYISWGRNCSDIHKWLTLRDTVSDTSRALLERLSAIVINKSNSSQARTVYLRAKVWFDSHPPVSVQLASHIPVNWLSIVEASFTLADIEAVSDVASVINNGAEVAAYDISLSNVEARRFIVRRHDPRYREFLFINRFGATDRVIAYGAIERKLSGESKGFVNSSIEKEISGDIRETFSVSSGRLHTAREATIWLDFFESTQRYIFEDGVIKRIVIEGYQTDLKTGTPGKVSFTYHISEASDLPVALDETPLEDYDYSTTSQNKGSALLGYGITSSIEP